MADLSRWIQDVQPLATYPDSSLNHNPDHLLEPTPALPDWQSANYKEFVCHSNAYNWLVTSIDQHWRLSSGGLGSKDLRTDIGRHVRDSLRAQQSSTRLSRREGQHQLKLTVTVQRWNPIEIAMSNGFKVPMAAILEEFCCLTGSWEHAQLTTVKEYIKQVWPTTGEPLTALLHEVLSRPQGKESTCKS